MATMNTREAWPAQAGHARSGNHQIRARATRPGTLGKSAGGVFGIPPSEKLSSKLADLARRERAVRPGAQCREPGGLHDGMMIALAIRVYGGSMRLDELCQRSGFTQAPKALRREDGRGTSLEQFCAMLLAIDQDDREAVMADVCWLLGGSFVPDRSGDRRPLELRALSMLASAGSVSGELAEAMADGRITTDELHAVRDALARLDGEVDAMLAAMPAGGA